MSIDLYVFPTSPANFCWGELKSKFLELLTSENAQRLGEVFLHRLGSDEIIPENENMSLLNDKNHDFYYLSLDIRNTLGIGIQTNEPNYVSEVDMLEDFARNLDAATIQALIQKWKSIGYVYSVDTSAGRSKWEPTLFIALATAIAYLCQGYVIVMNDVFSLDVGVYTPNEFEQTKMVLSANK